jgi:hypothetical protein
MKTDTNTKPTAHGSQQPLFKEGSVDRFINYVLGLLLCALVFEVFYR